jgi:hypothetical protein
MFASETGELGSAEVKAERSSFRELWRETKSFLADIRDLSRCAWGSLLNFVAALLAADEYGSSPTHPTQDYAASLCRKVATRCERSRECSMRT